MCKCHQVFLYKKSQINRKNSEKQLTESAFNIMITSNLTMSYPINYHYIG